MKKKALTTRFSCRKKKMEAKVARHFQVQLGQVSLLPFHHQLGSSTASAISNPSLFQNFLESEALDSLPTCTSGVGSCGNGDGGGVDEKEFILSQDFFCTPDYITPDNQHIPNSLDNNKDNIPCPESPGKLKTVKNKRFRQDCITANPLSPTLSDHQVELGNDIFDSCQGNVEKKTVTGAPKKQNYVSQSAVALRCRVMPPPCITNPYLKDASDMDVDPFGNQRSKCAGFFPSIIGGDGLSRYHTDFHEIEQIGTGNFSRVFKVLKRIDGCIYAVKHSTKQLYQDRERTKALMEVQALAALGSHQNIVGYYSSWFENEQLYIQMELCEHSLSISRDLHLFNETEVLEAFYQIAKALQFIHERGIAHLDVKPDNIYVKNGVYKLGDFGCATLLDKSLPIEEGDARYMPQEILNDKYDYLEKVDIFSLGATIFELIRGSPLLELGTQISNLREGKLPLLPSHSLPLQYLLKLMVDPDPVRRPSSKELVENSIFDRVKEMQRTSQSH